MHTNQRQVPGPAADASTKQLNGVFGSRLPAHTPPPPPGHVLFKHYIHIYTHKLIIKKYLLHIYKFKIYNYIIYIKYVIKYIQI